MNYSIDYTKKEPAYIQLYRFLVKDIVSGVYSFGERLPSKRTIASDTGVSVITAEHALSLLADEGYVESRLRSGNYVSYRSSDFPGRPDLSGNAARTARQGTTHAEEHFPFTVIAGTTRRVLAEWEERLFERSPNPGMAELREEISRYLSRSRGIQVAPAQVIVGSGAEYLYGLVAQFFGRDAVFALENPSYSKIRQVYESLGNRCEMLPMAGDGIDSGALRRSRARVLHVTPFNSYPSGITADISKKNEYLQWARERNGVIIEDNYDSELTVSHKPEEPLFAMADGVDVIYINTFSRTIAPSIRVGYLLLPEHMVPEFTERLGFYACTVPVLDQIVIAELLRRGDFERHINRIRRKRRNRKTGEKPQEGVTI